jgi:two-component system phosphate regulon sensor histidine kinase PhoR
MFWRISVFLGFIGTGALLGWWLLGDNGLAAGLAAAAVGWFVYDTARGLRVARWLRRGELAQAPAMSGLWGEVADRARRALREREQHATDAQQQLQQFLAAIQASPNGVVLLDANGRIDWCNQTAAGQLGFDPVRDRLQQIGNLVRDPAFAAYYTGRLGGSEITIHGRDSTPGRPVRISVHLHPYGDGRRLMLSRDVTALEQAETMRRDFVANVSHEVRTPLTVLAGFVETLQNLPLPPQEQARYLALMAQQARRMQTLVDDLLTLSRLEGSPPPGLLDWMPVHDTLEQLMQEAHALSRALGRSHDISVERGPALEVGGSASELQSAMSNLVGNAVRYTPPGGQVKIGWHLLQDGRGEFRVRDSGPGIAPEHLPRLTERFYRVDRSRSRETGGTGLGLAIVKHVAQRHGAELRIESTPGAGSVFTIVFPATRLRQPPAALEAGEPEPRATTAP